MTRYVIIGDGAAGTAAAQAIRQSDQDGVIEIYSEDPNPAYFRAALTNYLIGELREDQIWAVPPTFYSEYRVQRVLARVEAVDFARSQVVLARDGRSVAYDRLLIATGSRARLPPFENAELPGVMTMRTLQDVRQVMDRIRLHGLRRAVVIGGGPLALEWAQGLHERGVKVTILLRGTHFMGGALDAAGSDLVLARLRQAGVRVLLNEEAAAAVPGKDGAVAAVRTKSGETIPCELIGVAIGVLCNSEFLKSSDVVQNKRGAVVANRRMQTNINNVFAAGDVASVNDQLLQLWEPARWHGRIAGRNMAGAEMEYEPGTPYIATRLFDLDFASIGKVEAGEGEQELAEMPAGTGSIAYRKAILRDGVLVGAQMLGERKEGVRRQGRAFKKAIDQGADISQVKEVLLKPGFDLSNRLSSASQMGKPEKPAAPRSLSMADLRKSQAFKANGARVPAAGSPKPAITPSPEASLQDLENGRTFPVRDLFRIGRAPENELTPEDPHISSYHAEIRWQGTGFFLHDLDSKNGTFLNDQRVSGSVPLNDGAILRLGLARFAVRIAQLEKPKAAKPGSTPSRPGRHLATVGLGTMQLAVAESGEPAGTAYLELNGQRWELTDRVALIGRDPENAIVLDDAAVSHIHAQISRQGEERYLQDLGSRNGTWVNGKQVTVPHPLVDGDRLHVGKTELTYRSPASPRFETPVMPQEAKPRQTALGCPKCGEPVSPTARFCPNCGHPLKAETAVVPQAALLVTQGPNEGHELRLGEHTLIGWDPEVCQLAIDHETVSRRHAEVVRTDKGFLLRDLGSLNGTFLNKEKVPDQGGILQDGDVIGLGKLIGLTFRVSAGELVDPATPDGRPEG